MKKQVLFLKTVASLVIVLLISPVAYSKKPMTMAHAFRIKLNVSASEKLKNQLNKCLTNQLTSFSDVILVDNDAEWELSIAATETRSKGVAKSNIILSVIISSPFSKNVVDMKQLLTELNPFQASYMRNYFSNSRLLLEHWLRFDSADSITRLCQGVVTDFDSKYLDKSRKLFQRSTEIMKRQKVQEQ